VILESLVTVDVFPQFGVTCEFVVLGLGEKYSGSALMVGVGISDGELVAGGGQDCAGEEKRSGKDADKGSADKHS